MLNTKEIRKTIRLLRKIKRDTRKGTQERRDLNKKIRALKEQLIPIYKEVSDTKQALIQKILELRPEYKILGINLIKFTEEELTKHIETIKKKGRLI